MTNLDIKELIKIPYSCSPTSSVDNKRIAYIVMLWIATISTNVIFRFCRWCSMYFF